MNILHNDSENHAVLEANEKQIGLNFKDGTANSANII